jgi:phosphoglycerate dehydrogenase-like enzyme
MTTILIETRAFLRLEAELRTIDSTLEFILMQPDGSLTFNGKNIFVVDAQPEIAWLNVGLARTQMTQSYVKAVLATGTVKWLQTFNTGLDHAFYQDLFAAGIRISNSNAQAISIAEYVIANVLAHYQNVWQRKTQQQNHHWQRTVFREMWRSRWLLIGFGNIGQALAQRLRAFECKVIGVRRTAQSHPLAEQILTLAQLPDVLPTADVVVIACTLTPKTKGLAGKRFFEQMKPEAVLVNVARGKIVDQPALLEALKDGLIEHAILDVFDPEPLPDNSPLWDMANVTVTSHTSNFGHNTDLRGDLLFLENLRRYLGDKPLLNEVPVRPS